MNAPDHTATGGPTDGGPLDSGALALGALAVVVAVGAALRIGELHQSLSGDELWTYVGATQDSLGDVIDWVSSDEEITPPLYSILAWLSAKVGDPTVWIRVPALIGGILTIPLTYALGLRALGSRGIALLAATLVSLSAFMAWQSVEARAYGLVIALVAASTLTLLLAIQTRRGWWWAAYAALSCAAMFAHYTAAFVLIAQLGWCLYFHPKARRPALLANLAAAVCFLPWLPGLFDDLDSPTQSVYERFFPFDLDNFVDFTTSFAVGHPSAGLNGFLGPWAEAALLGGLALAIVGAFIAWLSERGRPAWLRGRSEALILVGLLALAAPVGAGLLSLLGTDIFLPRNLAVSWPGLAVALAALLAAGPVAVRAIAVSLVLGAFAYGAIENVTDASLKRPAYRSAAALVDEETGPADVVLDVAPIFVGGGAGSPLTPPSLTLDVHLDEPHVGIHYIEIPDGVRAVEAARGHRLALVGNPLFVGSVREIFGLNELTPVVEHTYEGVLPAIVLVYEIPADWQPRSS